MTTPRPRADIRVSIPVMQAGATAAAQQVTPSGLWLPAAALAASMALAAVAGVSLGILAATWWGIGGDRWIAVVQAHAVIQLWGWFAVAIAALVFEFIVRLNRYHALPVTPRVAVLLLFTAGALVTASGGVFGSQEQPLALVGATLLVVGSAEFALLVFRVPPRRPLRVDLHPLFFRTGAGWLVVSALLGLLGALRMSSGAFLPREFDSTSEVFLRGFVLNTIVAVGLRAFPSHIGLTQIPVRSERVLYVVLNASIMLGLGSTQGFGLPGSDVLARAADLGVVVAIGWATHAFGVMRAMRGWGRRSDRAQVMVPIAWAGLVAYGAVVVVQASVRFTNGGSTALMAAGGARHIYMLGFVAPLLVAMMHVVLERFGTGRLVGRDWLTVAFVLMVVAWPLRALPPLLDPATGSVARGLMGLAGVVVSVALLLASVAAARNAVAVVRVARQFGRAM